MKEGVPLTFSISFFIKISTVITFHLNLPDDSAPQQGEDHEENERAPDDKMVDPCPVMSVQRQLLERRKTRG